MQEQDLRIHAEYNTVAGHRAIGSNTGESSVVSEHEGVVRPLIIIYCIHSLRATIRVNCQTNNART